MTVNDTQLGYALASMGPALERHCVWAIGAVLETEAAVKEHFHAVESAPSDACLYCLIPNANPDYHAQLALGIAPDDIPALFPREPDPKMRQDALGELANVVSGLVMADEGFLERFGHLKPSTPFFSEGPFTGRRDRALRGKVVAGGRDILFHLSIRPQQAP